MPVQLLDIGTAIAAEEAHQMTNLVFGAAPIFRRKRVERQILQAQLARCSNDLAHGRNALDVAGLARKKPVLRPPAIAVHDDGDMPGKTACRSRLWWPSVQYGFCQTSLPCSMAPAGLSNMHNFLVLRRERVIDFV